MLEHQLFSGKLLRVEKEAAGVILPLDGGRQNISFVYLYDNHGQWLIIKTLRGAESIRYKEVSSLRAFLKQEAQPDGNEKADNAADPKVWPYMYFFQCLGDQEAAIEKILDIIASAEVTKQEAASQLQAKSRIRPEEVWDEMRLESDAISQEEVQDIFAGTLFVLLNNLLWSMAKRLVAQGSKNVPESAGRAIGGTSLFELIRAGGNNFRHYEQWHESAVIDPQMARNVSVLELAGLKSPWNRNRCGEILELIGWQGREELSREIRYLAQEIFQHQTGIRL